MIRQAFGVMLALTDETEKHHAVLPAVPINTIKIINKNGKNTTTLQINNKTINIIFNKEHWPHQVHKD